MSTQANKTIVQRFVEEAFNQGNMDIVDQVYAANHISHSPGTPEGPRGPAEVKQFVTSYRRAFPDLQTTVEDVIAEGDTVTYRWTARGTHQGELMGVPPTGKPVTITGITMERLAEGKIVEEWNLWDQLGMLQQLGIAPAPASADSRSVGQ